MSKSIVPEKISTLDTDLDHSTNPFILGVMAVIAGLLLSGIVLPFILPGLISSLLGPEPKVFWYLSRSSAIISYLMLWASMVFGLLLSSRSAKIWPGGFTANDLHQFLSIAGLTAGLFHGLILMGDHYMNISLVQVLLPFATSRLSTGMGGNWSTPFLHLGWVGLFLLHSKEDRHQSLAIHSLYRLPGICWSASAWCDFRNRYQYTLDECDLLGEWSECIVPDFLPGICIW